MGNPRPANTYDKGKNKIMDDEGFQQVRSIKNTRWNIFDNVDDDLRKQEYEHRSSMRRSTDNHAQEQITEGDCQTVNEAAAPAAALRSITDKNCLGNETTKDGRELAETASWTNQGGVCRAPGPHNTKGKATSETTCRGCDQRRAVWRKRPEESGKKHRGRHRSQPGDTRKGIWSYRGKTSRNGGNHRRP